MIKNINKPTSPFWNKVIAACSVGSAFIATYGALADHKAWIWAGGILGFLGTVLPILMPSKD